MDAVVMVLGLFLLCLYCELCVFLDALQYNLLFPVISSAVITIKAKKLKL